MDAFLNGGGLNLPNPSSGYATGWINSPKLSLSGKTFYAALPKIPNIPEKSGYAPVLYYVNF